MYKRCSTKLLCHSVRLFYLVPASSFLVRSAKIKKILTINTPPIHTKRFESSFLMRTRTNGIRYQQHSFPDTIKYSEYVFFGQMRISSVTSSLNTRSGCDQACVNFFLNRTVLTYFYFYSRGIKKSITIQCRKHYKSAII